MCSEKSQSLLDNIVFTSWRVANVKSTATGKQYWLLKETSSQRTCRLWDGRGDGCLPLWLKLLKNSVQEVRLSADGLEKATGGGWRFCNSRGLLQVSLRVQTVNAKKKRKTSPSLDDDEEEDDAQLSTEEVLRNGAAVSSTRKLLVELLQEDARWAHLASTFSLERVAKRTPSQRSRYLQRFYSGDPRVWYEPKLWLGDEAVAADYGAYNLCDAVDCLSPRRFAQLPLVLRNAWARLLGEHGRRHLLLHFLLTNTLSVRRDACFSRGDRGVSWARTCLPTGDDEAKMCFLGTTQLLGRLTHSGGPWCELVIAGNSPRLATEHAGFETELQALWDSAPTSSGTAQCAWIRVDERVFAPRVCFNQERQLVTLLRAVRPQPAPPAAWPQFTEPQRAALTVCLTGGVGLLGGAAGTGKTTAASAVSTMPVLFVAMTRNAVRNGRLRGIGGGTDPPAATSGTGGAISFPDYKTHAWLCTRARGAPRPTAVRYALIVDEVSLMSPAHLLQLLLALRRLAPNIARVLLLGDDAQLPPLGYGSTQLLVRALFPGSCAELTTVLRGAGDCFAQRLAASLRASTTFDPEWLRQCLVYLPFGEDGGPALAARLQGLHARHALPRAGLWARVQKQEIVWPDWQCVAIRRSEVALVNNRMAAAAGAPPSGQSFVLSLKVRLECALEALSPPEEGVELDPSVSNDVSRDDPRCVGYLVRMQDVTIDTVGGQAWVRGCRDVESTATPLAKGAWRVFTVWHSKTVPRFVQFWSRRQHGEDGGLSLAFCLTDFCVQGSEFDDVYVLLSPTPFCPLNLHLQKLLYTSLSRCRRSCEIWIPQRDRGATWPNDPTSFWQRVQKSDHRVRTITASRRGSWPLAKVLLPVA